MKYEKEHQAVSHFISKCERQHIKLPEDAYDAIEVVGSTLKKWKGHEKEALEEMKKMYGTSSPLKRAHAGNHDKESERKRARLCDEIREHPAFVKENQKFVDAFLEYGEQQLERGHTGKGSSHLRAALELRDYDKPIRSYSEARHVVFIGNLMAHQVEQVLKDGKITDEHEEKNVTGEYERPEIVNEIRSTPGKRKENQKIVDALTDYGEYQLQYGNTGKGVSHLRAAREIHTSDVVIKTASDALEIPMVRDVIMEKIDQILRHGKIAGEYDYPHRHHGMLAPILQELKSSQATCQANQKLVNAMTHYGEHQFQRGNQGKGTSHLRAAKEILHVEQVIHSGEDAMKIAMVGSTIASKIDHFMKTGEFPEDEEDEKEGQVHRTKHVAPIVRDLREHPAHCKENQLLVDRITDYGESHLYHGHRGKGISHLRAAKEIRNSNQVVTSGSDARKIGLVGNRVAAKIDQLLRQGTAADDETYEEGEEGDDEVEEEDDDEAQYGKRHPAPIVEDLRSKSAECKDNQRIVDALTDFGENELLNGRTGTGVSHLRAAREIRNCTDVIQSGAQARKVGMVGSTVAKKVDSILAGNM